MSSNPTFMQPTLPNYLQIEENLRLLMVDGSIDHRVPSENELALRYRVCRMTVRKALNELLRDGLVDWMINRSVLKSGT